MCQIFSFLAQCQNSLKASDISRIQKYTKMMERLVSASEETTNGVKRLFQMQANGSLLLSAISVNDSVTKSKFDDLYRCRHSGEVYLLLNMTPTISEATAQGFGDDNDKFLDLELPDDKLNKEKGLTNAFVDALTKNDPHGDDQRMTKPLGLWEFQEQKLLRILEV